MIQVFSKTGNGAFVARVEDDGRTFVSIEGGSEREFETARDAYDWAFEGNAHLSGTMRAHSYWNVCNHLGDLIEA